MVDIQEDGKTERQKLIEKEKAELQAKKLAEKKQAEKEAAAAAGAAPAAALGGANVAAPAAVEEVVKKPSAAAKLAQSLDSRFQNVSSYSDDTGHYMPRTDNEKRRDYWLAMQANANPKKVPKDFNSWMKYKESLVVTSEMLDYALPRRILLNFLVHNIWDYFYLTWLLIWLLALIIVHDRLAFKFR